MPIWTWGNTTRRGWARSWTGPGRRECPPLATSFWGRRPYAAHRERFDAGRRCFFFWACIPATRPRPAPGRGRHGAAFAAEARLRGVGEIGLDYYWDAATAERRSGFSGSSWNWPGGLGRPAVIHSREAEADTLAILDDMGFRDRRWCGTVSAAGRSLPGRSLARLASLDSRAGDVSEKRGPGPGGCGHGPVAGASGDGPPYLAPEPWRGKRNEPAFWPSPACAWPSCPAGAGRGLAADRRQRPKGVRAVGGRRLPKTPAEDSIGRQTATPGDAAHALHITTHGDIDQISSRSSLSREFVRKIYRHCWGKNNTPYFAATASGRALFRRAPGRQIRRGPGTAWNGWLSSPNSTTAPAPATSTA